MLDTGNVGGKSEEEDSEGEMGESRVLKAWTRLKNLHPVGDYRYRAPHQAQRICIQCQYHAPHVTEYYLGCWTFWVHLNVLWVVGKFRVQKEGQRKTAMPSMEVPT